jgi:molybdopterin-containing oxidoreductase family membrane subunit
MVIGFGALYARTTQGLAVTNLNNIVGWGLWVSFYIYFIGLSAGSFLLSSLVYVFDMKKYEPIGRMALFTALLSLMAGLLFILIDIGHMGRFWTVFFNRNWTSVLSWEIHFYIFYFVILVAELWLLMRSDLIKWSQQSAGLSKTICNMLRFGSSDTSATALARDHKLVKYLAIIGIPVAIGVHGGTGALFAVVKANGYWHTGIFPIIFLVSALISGGGLLLFITTFLAKIKNKEEIVNGLAKMVAGFIAIDLLLMGSEFLVGLYGEIPKHMYTFEKLISGDYAAFFWLGQLGLGMLLPLGLLLFKPFKTSNTWLGIAGLSIITGIFFVRLNIVIPPLSVPAFPSLVDAYHATRVTTSYTPSTVEWLSSLVIIAFNLALFTIGYKHLPIYEEESENEPAIYQKHMGINLN